MGKKDLNPYGDFIDDDPMPIWDQLARGNKGEQGLEEIPLLWFTSDNGCSPAA